MYNSRAKYLIRTFFPVFVLLLSVLCNAYNFQYNLSSASAPAGFVAGPEAGSSGSAVKVEGASNPSIRFIDFYFCEIEEVNNLEENDRNFRDNRHCASRFLISESQDSGSIKIIPWTFPHGASCHFTKKYILFHSFKFDC